MADSRQPQPNWRPAPSFPQAPWVSSGRPETPNPLPRGPPMPGMGMVPGPRAMAPPLHPAATQPPQSFAPRSPFRPTPPNLTQPPPRPMQPATATFPPAPSSQHPISQGPPSTGGIRPPGHVQPMYRPAMASNFAQPQLQPQQPMPIPGHGSMPFPAAPAMGPTSATGNEVLDKFEALTLAPSAPGVHDGVANAQSLPRPNGIIPEPPFDTYPQNAHHSFLRMTTIYAPRSGSLRERFQFPYGVVIQPLAEGPDTPDVPVIKLEGHGILRCRRCRTYINPFVKWVDGGRRWKCNVCNCMNDTPRDYFCSINDDGTRRDADTRPELSRGSVEYVAPPEYMVRAPMPAVYLFVVDVSSAQMSSEVLTSLSTAIRQSLDKIQGDDRKKIGFLTFDRTLHFYNLKASDSARMLVVPEIDDPFLPQPDDLLVTVDEARSKIEAFLESWSANFSSSVSHHQQSAMGAALQAAFLILNSTGGKMELFLCSPPSLGTAAVRNRENAALYNTDREPSLRNPEDTFYKRFAAECSRVHICIDVFSFCGQHTDLASIVCLPRYTGGQLYRYPGFVMKRDGGRLHHDIVRNLTRYTAWEGVMRMRCSKGLNITSFCGHFFIRSSDLLALPTCDPDKAFAAEMKHGEVVIDGSEACLQCALLYTSSSGERRIRVHTLQFPVTHELSDLYRGADAPAMISFMSKFEVDKSYNSRISTMQKAIEGKLIAGLREYRILHSRSFRGATQLIFPETLRYLPLWILGLLKCHAIRGPGPEVPTDERVACGFELMSCTIDRILHLLSPTLYHITDIEQLPKKKEVELPPVMPCSYESLLPNGVYLLDTAQLIFLLFGGSVPLDFLSKLTGVSPQSLKTQPLHTLRVEPPQKNELSQRVCALISNVRERRRGYQPVILLQLGTEQEQHLWSFLIEDRKHSMCSYLDFVQMLHRQIGGK